MTDREQTPQERLDAGMRKLPLAVEPGRDLWPEIASGIATHAPVVRRRSPWLAQAAAGILLVAGSSLLTATLLDRAPAVGQQSVPGQAQPPVPAPASAGFAPMPAAFGHNVRLDPEYAAARKQLTVMLQVRLAALPPSTRAKLETNLGEMQRAAQLISAALADQPGDPLLEELLLKTYQDELAVLASVNQLTDALASTPVAGKRMQL